MLLDEDSVLDSNSVSYPTLRQMLHRDTYDDAQFTVEIERLSVRSEKVSSKSSRDIAQIKVSHI